MKRDVDRTCEWAKSSARHREKWWNDNVSSVSEKAGEKAGKESKEKGWESRLSERNRFLDVSRRDNRKS